MGAEAMHHSITALAVEEIDVGGEAVVADAVAPSAVAAAHDEPALLAEGLALRGREVRGQQLVGPLLGLLPLGLKGDDPLARPGRRLREDVGRDAGRRYLLLL